MLDVKGVFEEGISEIQHQCDTKSVSTKVIMSPTSIEKREYMTHVPFTSAVSSLMYVMVCTRPHLSQIVLMISKYVHDPGRGHWETVKWIL